jgi:hypothetical protein
MGSFPCATKEDCLRLSAASLHVAPTIAVLSLLIGACGPNGDRPAVDGGPTFAVQDSAGVEIVTSTGPQWRDGDGWLLSSPPALRLGVPRSTVEQQFDRIRAVTRLLDGTVVVADGGSQEIRFFEENGRFTRKVGGSGDGPGEFGRLGSMVRTPGDTLVIWDSRNYRFSFFSPTGTLVDVWTLDLDVSGLVGAEFVGRLGDGGVILTTPSTLAGADSPGLHRSPRPFVRVGEGDNVVDTLAVLPGFEYAVTMNGGVISFEIPFARNAYAAVGEDQVFVGYNDRFEIQELDRGGNVMRLIRYPRVERLLTESETAELEAEVLAYIDPSPSRRRSIERLFREPPPPDLRPAFSGFLVDTEENLWVADWISGFASPQRAPASWFVFAPEGNLLGSVNMPVGFRPMEVGSDYVIGISRDDLEVERVELYGLQK